jgi:hypothetical protein
MPLNKQNIIYGIVVSIAITTFINFIVTSYLNIQLTIVMVVIIFLAVFFVYYLSVTEIVLPYLEALRVKKKSVLFRFRTFDLLKVVTAPSLAGKLLRFDIMDNVYIVYTHRKNDQSSRCNEIIGEKYIEPAIPRDEASFVYLLMHWALSSPSISDKEVKSKCSCELIWDNKIMDNKIIMKNLVIIGINECATFFQNEMKQVKKVLLNYYIEGKGDKIIKSADSTPYQSMNGTCYGLITIAPNPFIDKPKSQIILIAGSHRTGQKLITKWFNEPWNLIEIIEKYPFGYFQIFLRGTYDIKTEKILTYEIFEDNKITPPENKGKDKP